MITHRLLQSCKVLVLLFIVLLSCAPRFEGVPEGYQKPLREALNRAGTNKEVLLGTINELQGERRIAAAFLIMNMPTVDLTSVDERTLRDNIDLTFKAKEEFPWGRDLSQELFLHYLLPHRVSQEPLENWRPYFYEQLRSVVEACTSGYQAAVEVNRWCGEKVKFKYTQPRDQGPFETLASGYGRCEEMVIVFVVACRAVGIPAREAWTPYWATCDNNHAWAEVFCEGKWYYTGACEPKDSLNDAWFSKSVKRAALVFSKPYGIPESEPGLYLAREGDWRINSTDVYLETGQVDLSLTRAGREVPDTEIRFAVFNFGSLRPIAKVTTDKEGKCSFKLGGGTYLVSTGDNANPLWEVVQIKRGQTVKVELDLSSPKNPLSFWLNYPPEEEKQNDR
jgi:hypothetical protein